MVEVFHFDLAEMLWSKPIKMDFIIEAEPFTSGEFRQAFKATSKHQEFKNAIWVTKKYTDNTKADILETKQTLEEHTKKCVQMHYLARNFSAKLKEEVIASGNILFGETLQYNKIFI